MLEANETTSRPIQKPKMAPAASVRTSAPGIESAAAAM